jgi:multiple sugar transport system permease protein
MSTQSAVDIHKMHQKKRAVRRSKRTAHYVALSVITIFYISPIIYMVIGSFKPTTEVLGGLRGIFPEHLSLDNYRGIFKFFSDESTGYFWRFYLTSTIVSSAIVFGGLIVNSMAAYSLARLKWLGRNTVLTIIILLVILPFEAIAVPLFYLLNNYRNTYLVQYLPFIANAFSIYLFYTFFINLPVEIQESARIDGAGPWKIFRSIIVPMSKPVFASVTILTFLASWSAYLFPVMMVDQADKVPLPVEIVVFFTQPPTEWGQVFAFGVMLVLPVLIVFLAFQRWFIQSVASSAIKG